MYETLWLIGGALLALVFITYARSRRHAVRAVYGTGLVVAACLYVVFAFVQGTSLSWLLIEAAGVAVFGVMAVAGVRWSAWWLAAGWALHPVWDLGLHYFGPGGHVAPHWYAVGCMSFDLCIAYHAALRVRAFGNPMHAVVGRHAG
jgi:hypothetical protein